MVLEVSYLIRQQETVGHKFVVYREETLESANDNAEYVFLSEMIHQWISVEYAFSHFYYV